MTETTASRSSSAWSNMLAWCVAIGLFALTGTADAQTDVTFDFGSREVWVGQSFNVVIDVVNAESHDAPTVPSIEGASTELLPGTQTSSFVQVVNGVVTKRETISYTLRVTPERSGIIEIPPILVEADGRTYESRPWRLVASRSEVGDLLFVEVEAEPPSAWIGEAVEMTLRIWVKQYRSSEEGIALDESNMWSLIDQSVSRWGVFGETLDQFQRERRRPLGREIDRNGSRYFLYEITTVKHPIREGEIDSGEIRVVLRQPTGIRVQRDLFGRRDLNIEGVRPVVAVARDASIQVRELPETGRPSLFTGAVGRFRIRAMAEPTNVAVGDPITLILEIEDIGDGPPVDLSNLRPPELREDANLVGFRIPDTPTTGVVEGRTKVFTETLRPERDDLTEIPPIAFPSFDPDLNEYVIARTAPISIVVSPSERLDLDLTLRGSDLEAAGRGSTLTSVDDAIRANHPVTLGDLDDAGPWRPSWTMSIPITLPPAIFFAGTLLAWRRRHRLAHPELLRAGSARARARARLEDDRESVPDRVMHALCDLVGSRLHLAEGSLTARETVDRVREAGAPDALVESLDLVLRRADASRYDRAGRDDDETLLEDARRLVDRLDDLRPADREGAA